MIMRMTGIAMIVFSCAGLGVIKSAQLQKRYRLLKEWERLIVLLEQEISYNAALPEACRRVGRKARPPFNSFLDSLSGRLKDCGGTPFPRILEEESGRHLKRRVSDEGGPAEYFHAGGDDGIWRQTDTKRDAEKVWKRAGDKTVGFKGTAPRETETVPQPRFSGRGISGYLAAVTKKGEKGWKSVLSSKSAQWEYWSLC